MVSLLLVLVLTEAAVALLLMLDVPSLRNLAMKVVNNFKSKTGAAAAKTIAGSVVVMLASTITSIYKIEKRILKLGSPTSADHFMLRTYLLDAALMGFVLFLTLIVSHLHRLLQQISSLKLSIETLKKQSKAMENEYLRLKVEGNVPTDRAAQNEIASLKDLVLELRKKMEDLQLDSLEKEKLAKAAEANAKALQKQSEGFLLEYDRLLEDNENLRSQLISLDRKLSHSDSKKHA